MKFLDVIEKTGLSKGGFNAVSQLPHFSFFLCAICPELFMACNNKDLQGPTICWYYIVG
jgi:hypothetical protein